MEASESLSIESFSYSWLVNLKPSFESSFRASFDAFDDSNFIEMDPKASASKRFLVFHQDFDFDLPTLQPTCVHADELISNGILVPLFLNPLDIGIYDSVSSSTPVSPVSSATHGRSRSLFFRRYPRLPKRVVRKYLNLVRLIWLRMRRGRRDSDSDSSLGIGIGMSSPGKIEAYSGDNWRRSCDSEMVNILGFEGVSSPRISEVDNWRRSCDSESSIYEAVLHCKKTIGINSTILCAFC
ncbi:hypothetical protein L2E82_07247 [Cichorium intybus]|uniref:Uncharacterized protein n=1 Tax=Cichorium intybus TaxID=13427 RepID=A0ACB9G446_CICIN|nr:hypothetical protein L2E82_07247 [Cichorium intybus]